MLRGPVARNRQLPTALVCGPGEEDPSDAYEVSCRARSRRCPVAPSGGAIRPEEIGSPALPELREIRRSKQQRSLNHQGKGDDVEPPPRIMPRPTPDSKSPFAPPARPRARPARRLTTRDLLKSPTGQPVCCDDRSVPGSLKTARVESGAVSGGNSTEVRRSRSIRTRRGTRRDGRMAILPARDRRVRWRTGHPAGHPPGNPFVLRRGPGPAAGLLIIADNRPSPGRQNLASRVWPRLAEVPERTRCMSSQDRRSAPRHVPLFSRVFVAWEDAGGLKFVNARLSDLSSGGAGISVPGDLPAKGLVWIGLEGTPMRDWAQAEVVRIVPGEMGLRRAGLQFTSRCPLFFFKRAIWGASPMEAGPRTAMPHPRPTNPRSCWSMRTTRAVGMILHPDRSAAGPWSPEDSSEAAASGQLSYASA